MTTPSRTPVAAVLVLLCLFLLAACSSTVVRTPGTTGSPKTSTPKPGASVVVKRGDTLYRLAVSNGISPMDLALWNGISAPYTIYPGQRLWLYPRSGARTTRTASAGSSSAATRPPVRPTQTPPQPAPQPPVRSNIAWRWPTEGQIINRFATDDPTRQGVDIAGKGGQPVRAAADGVVVYSGSGLVGYGELVIVKHDEQWLSAYGHNRTRLVNEGARVRAGEQIAEMGSTGTAREMLHFEIRYNGKPVDPLQYLPRRGVRPSRRGERIPGPAQRAGRSRSRDPADRRRSRSPATTASLSTRCSTCRGAESLRRPGGADPRPGAARRALADPGRNGNPPDRCSAGSRLPARMPGKPVPRAGYPRMKPATTRRPSPASTL